MKLRDTMASRWFKVEDLPNSPHGFLDVTIAGNAQGKYQDGKDSLEVSFYEHPKPLGLNVTNRKRLMLMFGNDVGLDELTGRRIRLYAELTQDQSGSPIWGVRIQPVPETIQYASQEARERIEAAALRQTARTAIAAHPAPQRELVATVRLGAPLARAAHAPQTAPIEHARPMSHRPLPAPPAAPGPVEPAGFVDDQDPGFDQDSQAGGRW